MNNENNNTENTGEFDETIDSLVHHVGEENNPLEIKLEQVLEKTFDGELFHFAGALAKGVESCGCKNCTFTKTCDLFKENVDKWADKLLSTRQHTH